MTCSFSQSIAAVDFPRKSKVCVSQMSPLILAFHFQLCQARPSRLEDSGRATRNLVPAIEYVSAAYSSPGGRSIGGQAVHSAQNAAFRTFQFDPESRSARGGQTLVDPFPPTLFGGRGWPLPLTSLFCGRGVRGARDHAGALSPQSFGGGA